MPSSGRGPPVIAIPGQMVQEYQRKYQELINKYNKILRERTQQILNHTCL